MFVYLIPFFKVLCLLVSSNTKVNNLCASSQQTTNSKVLTIPSQQGIFGRRASKNKRKKLTVTSRAISFQPSSNISPPSPPCRVSSKRKSAPEEKYN